MKAKRILASRLVVTGRYGGGQPIALTTWMLGGKFSKWDSYPENFKWHGVHCIDESTYIRWIGTIDLGVFKYMSKCWNPLPHRSDRCNTEKINTTALHLLEGHAPKYWFKLTRACVRVKATRLMHVCNLLPKRSSEDRAKERQTSRIGQVWGSRGTERRKNKHRMVK
jgi:hypothetical protein